MMQGEYSVYLKDMIEALKLENCTPDVDIDDIMITQNEVNRPALQLAGYFDYFDSMNWNKYSFFIHLSIETGVIYLHFAHSEHNQSHQASMPSPFVADTSNTCK